MDSEAAVSPRTRKKAHVSNRWIAVTVSGVLMAIVSILFAPTGFPWVELAGVALVLSAATWMCVRSVHAFLKPVPVPARSSRPGE